MTTKACLNMRWMVHRDMPEVLAIEQASFEFPWREEDFIRVLRQRNHIGMVVENRERIICMCVYALHHDYVELLTFAVHPKFHRCGMGRQMIARLIGRLSIKRRKHIILYVRETNLPAQLFLRAVGFRARAVLHGYFQDTGEDGYAMSYFLSEFGGAL